MKNSLVIILIVTLGFGCYFNSLFGEFIWDDFYLIVQNPLINNPRNVGQLFTSELSDNFDYYRPVQLLSYLIDSYIYKKNPMGFHLTSVVIHILNALVIFFIIFYLLENRFMALVVSLFFVSAPFHTEAVTYIAGRADLLLGFFFLSSFLFYIRRRLFLALLFFVLSLFCREQAMVLPFMFILYDQCFNNRYQNKVKYYLLFFLYDIIYIVLRLTLFNFSHKPLLYRKRYFFPEIDFWQRLLIFQRTIIEYLKIILYPVNLHMERKIGAIKNVFNPDFLLFILILAGIIYALVRLKNSRRLILFCLFWFLILLLPQSSFVFPLIMAEHFLYLPCISIFILFALLLGRLWQKRSKLAHVILTVFIIYYFFLTVVHNINWQKPLVFYRWTIKFAPNSYKLHYLLGNYYLEMGNLDLAFEEYKKAIEVDNNFMFSKINMKLYEDVYRSNNNVFANMYHNMGAILSKKDYIIEAEESFKKAIELNPDLVESYNDLGILYIKTGEINKAEEILSAGLKINPKFERIYYNLGIILAQRNDLVKAAKYWNKALELNPDYEAAKEAIRKLNENN